MPRNAEQLEQVRTESRHRILASASELFALNGYAATSVRMIAEHAGISQGLLYNYFDGKAALLRAIFQRSVREVERSFALSARGETPGARVEGLIRAAFRLVRENLAFWRLTYQLRMQPGVLASLGADVRSWNESVLAQLRELLAAAGASSPAVEARLLYAAIDGAAQHFALDSENYPIDDVAAALVRRFTTPATAAGAGGEDTR